MNKKSKYTIIYALIGGVGKALVNINEQMVDIARNPDVKFSSEHFLLETFEGVLAGGLIGLGAGAIADYENGRVERVHASPILLAMADKAKLTRTNPLYIQLREKADDIIEEIKKKFGHQLKYEPFIGGSTEKGTATRHKFDIDIFLSFGPTSFSSTAAMYDAVYFYLKCLIGRYSIIEVRDQSKSVGIFLLVGGRRHKIDVVPSKISKPGARFTAGYLCLNNKSIWGNSRSYTKTDFYTLKKQKLSKTQQRIVVLLKCLKIKHDLPLSSYLLENLVLDAYQYNYVPNTFEDKLVMVLQHITDNLDIAVIRSIENTNNIITNIPNSSKMKLINACNAVIKEYKYQPNSIVEAFK